MSEEESAGLLAAKWVVGLGGHVIPAYVSMKTGDKYPLVKEWVNAACRDEECLNRWWDLYGYAWPGVVSRPDGLVCFDLDGPEAVDWFRELCISVGWTGEGALIYRSPGRGQGLHIWFKWPTYLAPIHSAKYREVDWNGEAQLRGVGCWTMMAGARRPDGEYTMVQVPDSLSELPRELWLAFAAEASQQMNSGGGGDLRELSTVDAWERAPWTDGRKNAVAALAWWNMLRGMEEEECLTLCLQFAREACLPELDEAIVRRKVEYTAQRIGVIREKQARELSVMRNWVESI